MALALLRPKGREGEQVQFDIELGRNRYYSYAVGDGELDRTQGFAVLLNRKVTSPLLGPIADHPSGRATLEIPVEEFDRTNRYVQLATFRTAGREGPAVSEVVTVSLGSIRRGGGDFPTLSLGMGSHMAVNTQRQPVPFSYVEARPISQAMFLGALLPIIQNALPVVNKLLPVVGKLFGGGGGNGGGTAVAAQPSAQIDQILGLLQQFLAQVTAGKGLGGQQSLAFDAEYSQAQNPALLAAAPMLEKLMPLLQQVLTPETVKAVVDSVSPVKMIGAVKEGLMEVGKLGLENNKELNRFLKSLDPGVDDPGLDRLLESMSVKPGRAFARSLTGGDRPGHPAAREPMYQRVTSVSLDFTGVEPQLVGGRTRLCYRGDKLGFPLIVTTTRPIQGAKLHLLIKNPATGEILTRQRISVPEVTPGPLPVVPVLDAEAVRALVPGEEYLVGAYLLWRNKAKRVLGTSRTQLITVVGQYSLDRVEDDGGLIPLNDITKHRDFWHKIWQGSFTSDVRRATFECKYYVILEPGRQEHARMETLTKLEQPAERKLVGRLKSGFLASPAALNRLIPLVSSHRMLNEAELAALRSPDFVARFHQAARFKANLHGRPGVSAAVWVYPEIKMQKVVLYEATKVSDAGQVREFAEHVVHVPMPALLHYIGARTTS